MVNPPMAAWPMEWPGQWQAPTPWRKRVVFDCVVFGFGTRLRLPGRGMKLADGADAAGRIT